MASGLIRMPAVAATVLPFIGVADFAIFGSVTLSTVVGYAAVTGITLGLKYALSGLSAAETSVPSQSGTQALRQSIPPRVGGYGRAPIQGYYGCYEVGGYVSADVVFYATGKITGFYRIYLNDNLVDVNESTGAVSDAGGRGYYQYTGNPVVIIETRLGEAEETAYSTITAAIPNIWTSDHRGDGIASLALTCHSVPLEHFNEVYPDQVPTPRAVLDLYAVYDFRDVGQDREDPGTWEWSTNPIVCLSDYLTNADRGGLGLDYARAIAPNLQKWIAAADACDVSVVKKDSTSEPRYSCNGWYEYTTNPEEVIGSILASCDGWLAEDVDGSLIPYVGAYAAPPDTAVIEEKHILEFAADYGKYHEESANEMTIKYVSPAHDWSDVDGQAWRDEAAIAAAGAVVSSALDLTWVQSFSQARRLAKRAMYRQAATRRRATVVVGLYGLTLIGQRWIRLNVPSFAGFAGAIAEVVDGSIDLPNMRVKLDLIVIDPTELEQWDPETEEGDPPPVVSPRNFDLLRGLYTPEELMAEDAGGGVITLSWEFGALGGVASSPDSYSARYRPSPSGTWTKIEGITVTGPVSGRLYSDITPSPALAAGDYDIEVAGVKNAIEYWSAPTVYTVT